MNPGGETLLLDTHTWFWHVNGAADKISASARSAIDKAGSRNAVGISEISLWEIALKAKAGRLDLHLDPREWLAMARERSGIGVIEIDRKVLIDSALLDIPNRDPADRILVATAQRYNMRLATADEDLIRYAATNSSFQVLDIR